MPPLQKISCIQFLTNVLRMKQFTDSFKKGGLKRQLKTLKSGLKKAPLTNF